LLRTHTCGELCSGHIGTAVHLCGWVDRVRDHKGVIFIDIRDRWGRSQVVIGPESPAEALAAARAVRPEWVIRVHGTVGARPAGTTNPKLATGDWIGRHGGQLVYGGGKSGLMGVVADATLQAGGRVVGVIPTSLVERELAHRGCSELHVVDTMHERKRLMAERESLDLPAIGLSVVQDETFFVDPKLEEK
jgi:hypothetical protein